MSMLHRAWNLVAAVSLLGMMVLPVTVPACPAAVVKRCCCSQAARASGHCCCAKPAHPQPCSCAIEKARPDTAVPAAGPGLEPLGAGVLFAAPSATPQDSTPGAAFCHRIEPGWDPGNSGLRIPLRL